jgi:hypothetical protein
LENIIIFALAIPTSAVLAAPETAEPHQERSYKVDLPPFGSDGSIADFASFHYVGPHVAGPIDWTAWHSSQKYDFRLGTPHIPQVGDGDEIRMSLIHFRQHQGFVGELVFSILGVFGSPTGCQD